MDSTSRAEDLTATILSAASPSQISAAIAAVVSFLRKPSPDHGRSFFSHAFPSLICRLFGFDSSSSSSSSWIDSAVGNPSLSLSLFDLLSPSGDLVTAIFTVDRSSLVRYVFPSERLPESLRYILASSSAGSIEFFPFLKNRVDKGQLVVNVFEYYILWFAYYPVCRGNSVHSDSGTVQKSSRFRLESWTSSLPSLVAPNRRAGVKPECNLYLRLLYAYLCAFVPMESCLPYRSSLLHYSWGYDSWAVEQAEFLIYVLVHFWMVDNDFSPFPVRLRRPLGLSSPTRGSETPPTPGLGDVLNLLVKYVNCGLNGKNRKVYDESPVRKISGLVDDKGRSCIVSSDNVFTLWNTAMQRPLYRFILRTFLFCPISSSISNATQVFSLWLTYMEPWKTSLDDFVEFEDVGARNTDSSRKENQPIDGLKTAGKDGNKGESVYTPIWENYVASNYLFYSSLVVHFLGFAHKFLHTNVETVVQIVEKVLNLLTSSKELMDFLHRVDSAYHSKSSGPSSHYLDKVNKYVPSIREQLQDWEDGLCESDADGSFLHENWNRDLRLFSDGEDGALNLLKLFLLRAEHEIRAVSGDLQTLDSIRIQINILFGNSLGKSHSSMSTPSKKPNDFEYSRSEVFTPKHPGIGQRRWADVKYKGDWMRRPISDTEIAWLARLLIRVSDWLNETLGLDRIENMGATGPTYAGNVGGTKEAVTAIASHLGSWLSWFCQLVVKFMRVHGMRINLRVLASKKFVMVLIAYTVIFSLKKCVWEGVASSPSSTRV